MLTLFAVLSMVLIFGPFIARAFDLCPAQACMPAAYRPPRPLAESPGRTIEACVHTEIPAFEELPEPPIDVAEVEDRVRQSSVNKISGILTNFPQESVAIIRTWMMDGK